MILQQGAGVALGNEPLNFAPLSGGQKMTRTSSVPRVMLRVVVELGRVSPLSA